MIKAEFDGAEREFDIPREYVPFLERSFGRSMYAVLQSFIDGQWTFADTAAVVSFGLHGPRSEDKHFFTVARMAAKHGLPAPDFHYRPHPDVIAVLERDGHGNYASLAADILSDAIFGPASEEATDAAA